MSVDHRLSPKYPFPAAIIDVFLTYLELLYPGDQALHAPVDPETIVIAGESSGAAICLSLIQLIFSLPRDKENRCPVVPFHGRLVNVPMPCGVALLCPEADRSNSMPSWLGNAHKDWIPNRPPPHKPTFPSDHLWPSVPPRQDVYCHSSAFLNPISNPVMAQNWRGCPSVWIAYGEERCLDSGKIVATRMLQSGVSVLWSEYRSMPHIFPVVMKSTTQAKLCMRDWADACLALAKGNKVESAGVMILPPGDSQNPIDMRDLDILDHSEVVALVQKAVETMPV